MATSPSIPKITPEQLRELERDIRGMVEHDNDLLNHRIQWFLTINGFLLTAFAVFWSQKEGRPFGFVFAGVGLLSCLSFCVALNIGRKSWNRLTGLWKDYLARRTDDFVEIGVYGYHAHWCESLCGPWNTLPIILGIGWAALGIVLWLH